jgi:transcriptional regulator with XRE-family HTH domain
MRRKVVVIRIKLAELGMTQRGLARLTGIPEAHLSMIISGRMIPTSIQEETIGNALGCRVSELFTWADIRTVKKV